MAEESGHKRFTAVNIESINLKLAIGRFEPNILYVIFPSKVQVNTALSE